MGTLGRNDLDILMQLLYDVDFFSLHRPKMRFIFRSSFPVQNTWTLTSSVSERREAQVILLVDFSIVPLTPPLPSVRFRLALSAPVSYTHLTLPTRRTV